MVSIFLSLLLLFSDGGKFEIVTPKRTFNIVEVLPDTPAVELDKDFYIVMFSATWCPPCVEYETSGKLDLLKTRFIVVKEEGWLDKVPDRPVFWLCRLSTHTKVKHWDGATPLETFLKEAEAQRKKAPATKTVVTSTEELPTVQTQWGTINLETYSRNCDCPMCIGIRSLQAEYRQKLTKTLIEINEDEAPKPPQTKHEEIFKTTVGQEASPDEIINQSLQLLRLDSDDVLADYGCGDGRVLIEAVKRYGCSAVGVEIDVNKANEARELIDKAGLSHKILIVVSDVTTFNPKTYNVTAIYAYLYSDTLNKLLPQFRQVGLVACPFHRVDDLEMVKHGDVWLYDRSI